MSIPAAWPQVLDFFGTLPVNEPSAGQLSGDAGLLPIRQFDQRIGLTQAFTDALDDPRDPDLTEHSFLEMVRSRVYGIRAGYADQKTTPTAPALRCLRAGPVSGASVTQYRIQGPSRRRPESALLESRWLLSPHVQSKPGQ
jgi:hypothetical protein